MSKEISVAILASGRGTSVLGLMAATAARGLPVRFVLMLADRAEAPVLKRQDELGIPCQLLEKAGSAKQTWEEQALNILKERGVDAVLLVGFAQIVGPKMCRQYAGRMLNVHPSLLPKHAGLFDLDVHKSVIESGEKVSGATVHLVTEAVDEGEILAQVEVPVLANDTPETLKKRVQAQEGEALARGLEVVLARMNADKQHQQP